MYLFLAFLPLFSPLAEIQAPLKNEVFETQTEGPLIAVFTPPAQWKYARPKNLSPYVQAGFVGEGSTSFHPSINLATEEIDLSQKEYVQAVKAIHLSAPKATWRDLGKFSMKGGVGHLAEISNTSHVGDIKLLQAILVRGKMAYILTAATLKKDYPILQKEILKSLQSLSLYPNLRAAVSSEEKKRRLEELFDSLKTSSLEEFQKTLAQEYPDMGDYWQLLALQEAHTKMDGKKS